MPQNEAVGSPRVSQENLQATAEYWTEERRNAARPVPLPKDHPKHNEGMAEPAGGPAGQTPFGHGSEQQVESKGVALGTAVAQPLNYPYRTCGKIFFNQGGGGYAGSAAMVAPNVLLTAGHCVFNAGAWSTNMTFYPSYGSRAANDPVRAVTCGRLSAMSDWTSKGLRSSDFGLVWMGTTPGNVIGWLGLLWNAKSTGLVCEAVGYPATPSPPFNGNLMEATVGTMVGGNGTGTVGLNNDNMEHGSSGGPWLTAWQETVRSHVNSVQSFHLHDGDTIEYGPYFNQNVKTLFDWISNPANH